MTELGELARKVLLFLANYGDGDKKGHYRFEGDELSETVGLAPRQLNDAVEMLRSARLVEAIDALGTAPYSFKAVSLNPRGRLAAQKTAPAQEQKKALILFLASNPVDTDRIALDKEARDVREKIRASEHRDNLILETRWAVRADDLLQALNELNPAIVHFSGHGTDTSQLVLQNDGGGTIEVSPKAIGLTFKSLKKSIRVVVFNACYSRELAKEIVGVVDCAVGISNSIGDGAARLFSASFYRAIGFGQSVQEAFDQGVARLALEGTPQDQIPELVCGEGVDPSRIVLL